MAARVRERVPATVLRRSEGSDTPQPLLDLKAQRFMGVLKHPVPRSEMHRKFGVDRRGCKIVTEWCEGGDGDSIRAGDLLELGGQRYSVLGAKSYPGCYFEIYIEE